MDPVFLSRLQFAATTMFHFLFVPLTLGLSVLVAYMEVRYARTGNETYLRMTKFWGKLFLINFAVGVVTGITLEFQFGTNWSQYSAYVGGYIRAFAGHRGVRGILSGVDPVGHLDIRMEKIVENGPRHCHVSCGGGQQHFGDVDPDCQRMDAEPGGLCIQ